MNRFLIDKHKMRGGSVVIDDPQQIHHLKNVLRIKSSGQVEVFDGSGNEYIARVIRIGEKEINLEIKRLDTPPSAAGLNLVVACAIPKNVKMDDIVDKLTQLGVDRIIPLETERGIVRLDSLKKAGRLRRWEKISLSAAKQSHNCKLPLIDPVSKFRDVISASRGYDLKLIPTLDGHRQSLAEIFKNEGSLAHKVIILIGPEGDFTCAEISLAREAGFLPVSLGRRILRVDTAAVAAAAFIRLNEKR